MKLEDIGFYSLSDERAKNASVHSKMMRCELIILEQCNFKCPYCRGLDASIYGNRKIKQLSLQEIKHNIDLWCKNVPLENIRFSGGEPTLHKDIKEIISYAAHKGIKRIAISTNGSNSIELYKELVERGCNDFSISLDACCAEIGDKMAGNVRNSWHKVTNNIKEISKLCYVTVGVVLLEDNAESVVDIVHYAHDLGVSDIRIISASQYNKNIKYLENIRQEILDAHPILKFRVHNFLSGINVRGLSENDPKRCAIVLDDSVIAGNFHFPCVIYLREKGPSIGMVSNNMRAERKQWSDTHNVLKDEICKKNCLDVCRNYNTKYQEFHKS